MQVQFILKVYNLLLQYNTYLLYKADLELCMRQLGKVYTLKVHK